MLNSHNTHTQSVLFHNNFIYLSMKNLIACILFFSVVLMTSLLTYANSDIRPLTGAIDVNGTFDFILRYWIIIALVTSELASLLPSKYSGIVKSIITILTGNSNLKQNSSIVKSKKLKL